MAENDPLILRGRGVVAPGEARDWDVHIEHPEYPGMAVEATYAGVSEKAARERADKLAAQVKADPAKYFTDGSES